MKEVKKLYKVFLKAHPECQVRAKGCTLKATEIHHSEGRVGKKISDTKTFVAACHTCHRFLEDHPISAKETGHSKSRLT